MGVFDESVPYGVSMSQTETRVITAFPTPKARLTIIEGGSDA
jgi:hypothetical protein